jgi:Fe-S-cluster containining protein
VSPRLLIRPNARYECHGDGTCCTTIHLLGPLTKREAKFVKEKAPIALPDGKRRMVVYHDGIEDLVLATHKHRCVFLDEDARCRLHAAVGEAQKPAVCRHFPVGAAKTPHGTRVTLSHRCPCVSIGDGAPLDETRARSILASPKTGKIEHDVKVGRRVMWRGGKDIRFDDYVAWETVLLEQLDGPDPQPRLRDVLGMEHSEQLPLLRKKTWHAMSKRMLAWVEDEDEDDGFFCAVRWAALELRETRHPWSAPLRPWDWTLRRTARRVVEPVSPRRVFGSWLADYLWAMSWSADGTAYQAMANMAARYALARRLTDRLHKTGTRMDLAAAEAIMIVDTLGASEPWEWVQKQLVEAP